MRVQVEAAARILPKARGGQPVVYCIIWKVILPDLPVMGALPHHLRDVACLKELCVIVALSATKNERKDKGEI